MTLTIAGSVPECPTMRSVNLRCQCQTRCPSSPPTTNKTFTRAKFLRVAFSTRSSRGPMWSTRAPHHTNPTTGHWASEHTKHKCIIDIYLLPLYKLANFVLFGFRRIRVEIVQQWISLFWQALGVVIVVEGDAILCTKRWKPPWTFFTVKFTVQSFNPNWRRSSLCDFAH